MVNRFLSSFLPEKVSSIANLIDQNFSLIFWLSFFFFVLIQVIMVFFVIKYRKNNRVFPQFKSNFLEIRVNGKQWLWEFTYPDGRKEINKLIVPLGKPVKLIMTADDVLHSLFIPALRIKQDLVPNTYTYAWFKTTKTGSFPIYCAEYCGTGHSSMLAELQVLSESEYDSWLASKRPIAESISPEKLGEKLVKEKGCLACHSTDGTLLVGPTFKGIYGHEVELQDGSTVKVDENYIRESILDPLAKVVKGYPPVMPTFKGVLTDEEIYAIISYIKSLR